MREASQIDQQPKPGVIAKIRDLILPAGLGVADHRDVAVADLEVPTVLGLEPQMGIASGHPPNLAREALHTLLSVPKAVAVDPPLSCTGGSISVQPIFDQLAARLAPVDSRTEAGGLQPLEVGGLIFRPGHHRPIAKLGRNRRLFD